MNSPSKSHKFWQVVAALGLASCSSTVVVEDISDVQDGEAVGGIPFRPSERYVAHVYQFVPDPLATGTYKHRYATAHTLGDHERLYALNFDSQLLSNHTLDVEFHPNGTLDHFKLSQEQEVDTALNALATQLTAVDGAMDAQDSAAATAATNAQQALVDALEAYNDALEAELALEQLLANTEDPPTALDVLTEEGKVRVAQLKANQAYVAAGLQPPFPDVFP